MLELGVRSLESLTPPTVDRPPPISQRALDVSLPQLRLCANRTCAPYARRGLAKWGLIMKKTESGQGASENLKPDPAKGPLTARAPDVAEGLAPNVAEGLRLMQAFTGVEDPDLRLAIIKLVEALPKGRT